jgi:hypothetical protein
MTKDAIIRGFVEWAEQSILPQLTPTGMLSVGTRTALALARTNPALAETLLPKLAPSVKTILDMAGAFAGDDETFEQAITALKNSIGSEPGKVMRFQIMEVGLFNNTPHTFALSSEGVDEIAEKIRAAAAKGTVSATTA